MKNTLKKIALLSAFLALSATACQRSAAFKKDQNYYQNEPEGYYNKAKDEKGKTSRLSQVGQPKKRIVVLDFWNDTPVKVADFGKFAADELRRGIFLSQRMIIPPELKSELGTEDLVQGDRIKVAQLVREGRKLGVSVIAIGRVSKVVFRQKGDEVGLFRKKDSAAAVDIEVKLFDVHAGRELVAIGKSGEASSSAMVAFEGESMESPEYRAELTKLALRNASMQLVPEIIRSVEKMTWEGHIAKVAGGKVYVNAGKASGLVPGDILKVMTPGDDIYDPATGAYLGRSHGQLKGTLEVVDFIGPDGAAASVHTGGNFQEGDAVQLY